MVSFSQAVPSGCSISVAFPAPVPDHKQPLSVAQGAVRQFGKVHERLLRRIHNRPVTKPGPETMEKYFEKLLATEKARLRDSLKTKILESLSASPERLEELESELEVNGPFVEDMVTSIYKCGLLLKNCPAIEPDPDFWLQKIVADFELGYPCATLPMLDLIKYLELFGHEIDQFPPFNDPEKLKQITERLASHGIKQAQSTLLSFSRYVTYEKRITFYKKLSAQGNPFAQKTLGELYLSRWSGLPLSERQAGWKELIKQEEACGILNPFVSKYYSQKFILSNQDNSTSAEKIAVLTPRAKRGDQTSFVALWDCYFLDTTSNLTIEQRWEKLKESDTSHSKRLYTERYNLWVANMGPDFAIGCQWPMVDRFNYLVNQVEQGETSQIDALAAYWIDGLVENTSTEERIHQLERLARLGSISAMSAILSHEPPNPNNFPHLAEIMVAGNHLNFTIDLSFLTEATENVIRRAASYLKILRWTTYHIEE